MTPLEHINLLISGIIIFPLIARDLFYALSPQRLLVVGTGCDNKHGLQPLDLINKNWHELENVYHSSRVHC